MQVFGRWSKEGGEGARDGERVVNLFCLDKGVIVEEEEGRDREEELSEKCLKGEEESEGEGEEGAP